MTGVTVSTVQPGPDTRTEHQFARPQAPAPRPRPRTRGRGRTQETHSKPVENLWQTCEQPAPAAQEPDSPRTQVLHIYTVARRFFLKKGKPESGPPRGVWTGSAGRNLAPRFAEHAGGNVARNQLAGFPHPLPGSARPVNRCWFSTVCVPEG